MLTGRVKGTGKEMRVGMGRRGVVTFFTFFFYCFTTLLLYGCRCGCHCGTGVVVCVLWLSIYLIIRLWGYFFFVDPWSMATSYY